MIRDTFETNPGLCELFKRKIVERARVLGLSEGMIDFESQIDMKGTYEDNLRSFYREYPQLSQESDYFRIKPIRPLSGAVLERSWQAYERNNGHENLDPNAQPANHPYTVTAMLPELTITYTIGVGPVVTRTAAPKQPDPFSAEPVIQQVEANSSTSMHSELVNSILDHVTAMTGERVAKMILHQVGQEIGGTAYNYTGDQTLFHGPIEALDHVLRTRGFGRAVSLDRINHGPNVTYVCGITGRPSCHKGVSPSPTCHINRGVVSRWLESFVQKKAESIETACASASHPCVIRVTFRK